MRRWPYSDEDLRAMYVGGRGNAVARRFARFWAFVLGTGLFPRRWVTLEVVGRRTGRVTRFPLGMADYASNWYLVSMLGNDCNWVRNVRAAGGVVTIRHGRAHHRRLVEVPVDERAPILRRYLQKVSGARPHIPVDRTAPLAEFEAIAGRYPVFRVDAGTDRPRRRHRWLRWTIASAAVLFVLAASLIALAVRMQPTPAPLALPANPVAPIGPVNGTYQATSGSVAGFRVQQTIIGLASYVVGRTEDVTGTVSIVGGHATTARLRVGLRALTSGPGKPAPQFGISLDTQRYPDATVALAQPVALDAIFSSGATITVNADGRLTLHGVTRSVTVALAIRRDGTSIDVVGSFPIAFVDYGIAGPRGYGALGSLADHGVAEFLLVLRRI
jgi:polyisoprenoid-binding protein YceI